MGRHARKACSDLEALRAQGSGCGSQDVPREVCVCGWSVEVRDRVGGGHCSDVTFPGAPAFHSLDLFSALPLKLVHAVPTAGGSFLGLLRTICTFGWAFIFSSQWQVPFDY